MFCVDGFQFADAKQTQHYFLSHFHADHTVGLSKNFSEGQIYCSPITAALITHFIGVDPGCVHALPLDEVVEVAGVRVTLVDANHCPGAVVFIFHHPETQRTVVHTGDFRAAPCVCEGLRKQLQNQGLAVVDELYLDTTYASPRWSFPDQDDVLKALAELCAAEVKSSPRTLFVVGSYQIGKERAAAAIGRAIGSSVYVNARRWQMLQICGWVDERVDVGGVSGSSSSSSGRGVVTEGAPSGRMLFTTESKGCFVRMDSMMGLTHERLLSTLEFTKGQFDTICAFRPTGWTFSKRWRKFRPWVENNGATKVFSIPYSEHSSFTELRAVVCELRPRKIIPTVNVERRQQQIDLFAGSMDLSEDREHLDWYLGSAAQTCKDDVFVDVLRLSVGGYGHARTSSSAVLARDGGGGTASTGGLSAEDAVCNVGDEVELSATIVDAELSQVDLEKQRRLLRFFEQQQAARAKRAALLAGPAKRPVGAGPLHAGRTSGKKQTLGQAARKSGKRRAAEVAEPANQAKVPPRKQPRRRQAQGRTATSGGGVQGGPKNGASADGPVDAHSRGHRFIAKPSAQLRERIDRAYKHRMYLLAVRPQPGEAPCAELDVLGSTGNVYHVHVGRPRQGCTCADYAKHPNLMCKHILFVMLRVCKLQRDDPRVWQVALTPSEAGPLVAAMPSRESLQADGDGEAVVASPEVLRGFDAVSGNAGGSSSQGHARRPLHEEDCPICFEPFEEGEEGSVEWCRSCGNNAHADCMRRWRNARAGDCPMCRAPWPEPASGGGSGDAPGSQQDGAAPLNLSRLAGAPAPTLEELYPETAQWIRRRNEEASTIATGESPGRHSTRRPVAPQHNILAAFRKSSCSATAGQESLEQQSASQHQEPLRLAERQLTATAVGPPSLSRSAGAAEVAAGPSGASACLAGDGGGDGARRGRGRLEATGGAFEEAARSGTGVRALPRATTSWARQLFCPGHAIELD